MYNSVDLWLIFIVYRGLDNCVFRNINSIDCGVKGKCSEKNEW